MTDDEVGRVEGACAQLAAEGRAVTFAEIAVLAGVSRTTLYRRSELRAVVDEHRVRNREANTLSGLTVQIDQLRQSLEALGAKVRHHEEALRHLERQLTKGPR